MVDAALTHAGASRYRSARAARAIAGAFTDLAAAGAGGLGDLTAMRDLGLTASRLRLGEPRYQSINQVGAERFYRELTAAEAFLTAAVDEAGDEDRLHWLALSRPDAVLAEHARR